MSADTDDDKPPSRLRVFKTIWANKRSRVGLGIVVAFILLAVIGPLVLPIPRSDPSKAYSLPSLTHILGTDGQGEDIFAEIAYGSGFILQLSFIAAVIATILGTIVGITSGYFAGYSGKLLTAATDVALTIPGLVLVIVLSSFVKATDPLVVGLLLGIVGWAPFSRSVRSQIIILRKEPFIESAQTMSLSAFHILFSELMPNVMAFIAVNFVFAFEISLFASVGLYYLGVLPYNHLNWGTMMNQAFQQGSYLSLNGLPSLLVPLAAVSLLALGLILFSAGLEETFNPRLRHN
jgi:peptide/nickel transport system permease protein